MEFKSRVNYGDNRESLQGAFPRETPVYGYMSKNGKTEFGVTGKHNFYEQIQKEVPETSLQNILQRLMKGDKSAVGDVAGGFVDVVGMPNNLIEMHNLMKFSEQYFKGLPVDVRKKYENNIGQFLKDVDSAMLAKAQAKPVENKSQEVENESK